jgi:hypothetical protein
MYSEKKIHFIMLIERHWTTNDILEMTIEKLQLIATCNTLALQKTKFLKWWNSSVPSRDARRFPAQPVSEEKLLPFLIKCVWWAGVSI